MDYTYDIPNDDDFLLTLKEYLRLEEETELLELMKDAECHLQDHGQYSQRRWNAYYTTVGFTVPINVLKKFTDDIKLRLQELCAYLMPEDAGYDIMSIYVSPKIISKNNESLEDDLAELSDQILDKTGILYPPDLYEKGKEMAEVYLYLYHIENTLRIFIEQAGNNNLQFTRELNQKITNRKKQESSNQWMTFRGNSDLFYLDLKDLGNLIALNWDIFKDYFPSQEWIRTKITEMSACRNSIAHNSYIGDHEKDLLKLYYNAILRQIGSE